MRKGGKSKVAVKGKTPLELVSEVEEEEAPLPRSKTPASKKAPAADKPPSNVNGKIAKKQQSQQYTDVTIGLNDEEEREGRSKDKGLSRSTSTRSKSKPRSTAGPAKPSSSRSRSHSRAASRSKATDIEDEDELTADPEPEPEPEIEAESAPIPKTKARRHTKAPTAIEHSDVEDVLASKAKGKRQTKTTTKKATESESEDAMFIVKSTKSKPQKKPPSTALDVSIAREPSEKPPSTAAMEVDEQQPDLKASVPPSSKKRTTTAKKGGGSKTSSLSSSTSSAGSAKPPSAREPVEAEERLETLEEEVYDDADMQDFEEPAPIPEEPPAAKPASKPAKKKIETKPKPKPKRMELEEIAETDESAPPTRPASAASVREATAAGAVTIAAPPHSTAQAKPKSTTNGKTKPANTIPEPPQPPPEETMDVDVDDGAPTNAKKKPRSPADAPVAAAVPVLQPAAKIRNDKAGAGYGYTGRPATPERRPPPKVALTLTSPPASPTRSPLKASFLLPAEHEPTPPPAPPASIPTPSTPPPTDADTGTPPPASPSAAANEKETTTNTNTNTNPLALFIPPLASAPLALAQALTDAERAMTVEQWIRHEMDVQYAALQHDGEARIAAFRAAAEEVRRQIEAL